MDIFLYYFSIGFIATVIVCVIAADLYLLFTGAFNHEEDSSQD